MGMSAMNTVRYDNMVMYQTPSYSGFQFGIGYSFSANDKDADAVNRVASPPPTTFVPSRPVCAT